MPSIPTAHLKKCLGATTVLVWFLWRLLLALSCSVLIPSFLSSRGYPAVILAAQTIVQSFSSGQCCLVAPREIVLLANSGEELDDGNVSISGDRRHL